MPLDTLRLVGEHGPYFGGGGLGVVLGEAFRVPLPPTSVSLPPSRSIAVSRMSEGVDCHVLPSLPASLSQSHTCTHTFSHTRVCTHVLTLFLSMPRVFRAALYAIKRCTSVQAPLSAFVMLLWTLLSRYFLILSPSLSLFLYLTHCSASPKCLLK